MKLSSKFVMVVVFAGLMTGCNNKMEDDINSLLRPTPNSIVLMPSEMVVQNGETLLLPFRINPSTYQVTLSDLRLDVVKHEITKSSYVTSIEEYALEAVEARKGVDGVVREGEWVAKIKIKQGAYYSNASLALVLQYSDANNKLALITSSTITNLNTRVKLSDAMVTVLSSYSASANNEGAEVPSYIKIKPNPLSEGSSTLFDMKDVVVKSARITGDNADMFRLQASTEDPFSYIVTPDLSLFSFNSAEQRFVTANIAFILKDANSDTEITKQVAIKYYRTSYTAPVTEISLAAIEAHLDAQTKLLVDIAVEDVFSNVGATADLFKGLNPPITFGATIKLEAEGEDTPTDFAIGRFHQNPEGSTDPANTVFRLSFFDTPEASDYWYSVTIDYRSVQESHSRIHAVLKFPIHFIP